MQPERDRYQSLLESVADGVPVDWVAIDTLAATSAERARYRNLRLVARVAELHRTLVLDEEDGAAVTGAMDEAAASDPATWGNLSIVSQLASGSFGRIYRAHDPQLNRDVALKLLRGDIATLRPIERLLGEARTLAQVRHPNVVTVHGADVRDGLAGLWMELVDGQTLAAWVTAHGPMGAGEATSMGIDLCRALAAVHGAGLVHGDVKAQNVMREKGGRIVLMDFGAGRAQGADAAGVAGTPMYLAPEVLAGEPPTPQSDLYSLGVLFFHLLSASYPFSGADLDGLRAAHADGTRTWLRDLRPDLPDALVRSIERALDPDPARRFGTAGEMERALATAFQDPSAGVVVRSASPVLWRRWGFALGALALVAVVAGLIVWSRGAWNAPAIRSIAVLPMADLSGSSQTSYLADGLHDQLITTLGQIQTLRVTSRRSVLRFKDTSASAAEIAKTLGVDAVLESTLVATGSASADGPGRVRVNASLLIAGTNAPVWSRTFEGPRGDLLALEADIARAIAAGVRAVITPGESARLSHPQQVNPAAESAYLEGRTRLEGYGTDPARRALESFESALQIDRDYAAAHTGAAYAYIVLAADGAMPHQKARALARAHVLRALAINDDLAEAHATMADLEFLYEWNIPGAEQEYRKSLSLNPSLTTARSHYAQLLAATGRFDDALAQAGQLEALDPEGVAGFKGLLLYYKGDYQAAEKFIRGELIRQPEAVGLNLHLGRVSEAQGRMAEALDATRLAMQGSGNSSVPVRVQIIRLEALTGHRDQARESLRDLKAEVSQGLLHLEARDTAYILLAFGDRNGALDAFDRAFEERDPNLVWLGVDPRVNALRQDPRFAAMLRQLGLS